MKVKFKNLPTLAAPALTDYTAVERIGDATYNPGKSTWQKIFDLFVSSGISSGTYASGIVAAGTVQGDATVITKNNNRVDTVAAGTGVKNDITATPGFSRTVQNSGANDLLWYPFGTNKFYVVGTGLMGAGDPITIAPGNQASVICYDAGELTFK